MRRNGKKVLSLLLTLVLVLGMLPGSASAVASGTCGTDGDNITWSLENGVLTISGTGEMADYSFESMTPWYGQRASITSATISMGVTTIGNCAFDICTNLTSVTIPSSVISIGKYAFAGCRSLTSVIIPYGVTSIGAEAFNGCTGLASVTIPDSVTSIGGDAFFGCTSLTNVVIPNSVTSIEKQAFRRCTSLTSVTIPNSVTSIGEWTFYDCTSLTSVTIPSSVTSIRNRVFSHCTSLTSVTISSSVTSIGEGAFVGCAGLKDIYYSGSDVQWKAINIGKENDPLLNATIHYGQTSSPVDSILNDDAVFIKQASGKTCTLASATMMLRRRAILDGESNWKSITEADVRRLAWNGGLKFIFPYRSSNVFEQMNVITKSSLWIQSVAEKKNYLISLLETHPEGIVVYYHGKNGPLSNSSGQHAVLLTDYDLQTDTFFCADPSGNAPSGRIPFSNARIAGSKQDDKIENIHQIWYIVKVIDRPKTLLSTKTDLHCPVEMKITVGGKTLDSQNVIGTISNDYVTMTAEGTGKDRHVQIELTGNCAVEKDISIELVGTDTGTMTFTVTHTYSDGTEETHTFKDVPTSTTSIGKLDNLYPQAPVVFTLSDTDKAEYWIADVNETVENPSTELGDIILDEDRTQEPEEAFTFSDVPSDAWYYDAVYWAVENKITNGTSPTTFTPDRTCINTEIITLLWRAAGEPSSSAQLPFTVDSSLSYAEGALRWASEKYMIGSGFNQNAPCTRASAVRYIWQAKGRHEAAYNGQFTDVAATHGDAQAVAWAVNAGITDGTGTNPPTFSPNDTCTRGQIMTFLYRAYN